MRFFLPFRKIQNLAAHYLGTQVFHYYLIIFSSFISKKESAHYLGGALSREYYGTFKFISIRVINKFSVRLISTPLLASVFAN